MRSEDDELAREIVDSLALHDLAREIAPLWRTFGGLALSVLSLARSRPRSVPSLLGIVLVISNPVEHGYRLAVALQESARGLAPVTTLADARHADPGLGPVEDVAGVWLRAIREFGSLPRFVRYLRLRGRRASRIRLRSSTHRVRDEILFLSQTLRFIAMLEVDYSRAKIVVTDFDRAPYARPLLWAARKTGLRTVTAMHGSPAESTYLPLIADSVLTWGAAQARWLRTRTDATIHIIGKPDVRKFGAPIAELTRVVICHSRELLAPDEQTGLTDVIDIARAAHLDVVVRMHPSLRGGLRGSWAPIASRVNVASARAIPLPEFLQPGDFVIGVASTALIDALVAGHGVLVIAAEERALPADLEAIRDAVPLEMVMRALRSRLLPPSLIDTYADLSRGVVEEVGSAASRRMGAAIRAALERVGPERGGFNMDD